MTYAVEQLVTSPWETVFLAFFFVLRGFLPPLYTAARGVHSRRPMEISSHSAFLALSLNFRLMTCPELLGSWEKVIMPVLV